MENRSRSLVSRRGGATCSKKEQSRLARSASPKRASLRRCLFSPMDSSNYNHNKELATPKEARPENQNSLASSRPSLKWKSVVDPGTGRLYYYHRITRVSTWTKPKDFFSDAKPENPMKTQSFPTAFLPTSTSFDDSYGDDLDAKNRGTLCRSLSYAQHKETRSGTICSPADPERQATTETEQKFGDHEESKNDDKEGPSWQSLYQELEEVLEGQEVLLIQEEATVIGEEEETCGADDGDSDDEEESETICGSKDQESSTVSTRARPEEKTKSRFLRRSKKNNDSKLTKPEEIKDESFSIDKEAQSTKPKNRRRKSARKPSKKQSGRVVLLPTKHAIQEAAWNEEQARRLLLKALHTTDMDRRKKLCHEAFGHAHDAVDLRQEANDEKIGLVIDPKQIGLTHTWKRHTEDESTLTLTTVAASVSSPEGTLLSDTQDEDVLDKVQALQVMDNICGACIMHDDDVVG